VVDVLYFSDFIRVQVEHIEFVQVLQVSDSLDVVLTEHENSKSWDGVKMSYLFYLIVVKVQEN
jgi:hypothetical protein